MPQNTEGMQTHTQNDASLGHWANGLGSLLRNMPVLRIGMPGQQDMGHPFSRAAVADTTNVSSLPWLQTALLTPERARNHLPTFPKF